MPNLLEITGNDIAQLNDADLRDLIGLLCEADYRQAALSTKGIRFSGHQDAADGGLDVVVRDDVAPPPNSNIPRSVTGFQVKKPNLTKSKIPDEMRPEGILRQSIKNLIKENGAYIIISSGASATDTAYKERIDAMREAVSTENGHQNIHLDFFDQGRIATWVRLHPSLILWVRDKTGRQIAGWRPYENWANSKAGTDEEYLLDDGLRLHAGDRPEDKGLSVHDGIERLRSELSVPGASIRLAGLSGVGKTRLAQAMFDERIAGQALNPSQVFYTDIAFGPVPNPIAFAEQLISDKGRAILIVDNCPPELHHQLTTVCTAQKSTVSLLTIEYDVRDDMPEETSVFRLEPASEELIEKLIKIRFKHISPVDARTIAKFSGGNARIAIALANTVDKGETLSDFREQHLFERLFQQRHGSDTNLLMSAEVCSLVYSFEGTDTESEKSELNFLASLVNKTGAELYRDVSKIKERDLIQSRDVWRAVLPQAIANRLARRALESIPKDTITKAFISNGSERLVKSFSRRLGYLHDCKLAVEIIEEWLQPGGFLGETNCNFSEFGMDVFWNIAPVSPAKALEMIERAAYGDGGSAFTSRENRHYDKFVWLLRHLAYDTELFSRSAEIISRFALSEKPDENHNSTRNVLKSLFYLYLSGTQARAEARAKVIRALVDSPEQNMQELGVLLLDASLESWHFSSSYGFSFGAWPRNYGYQPKTQEEYEHWFDVFIDICSKLALSGNPVAKNARKLLADKFRALWVKTGMFDVLENTALEIHKQKSWNEGWIAVKQIIKYDSKNLPGEITKRIRRLEKSLRPNNLYELTRTYALSDQRIAFGLSGIGEETDQETRGWEKSIESTHKLGIQVAGDVDTLSLLMPELVSTFNPRIRVFGRGLAEGCSDRQGLWEALCIEFKNTPPDKRKTCVMEGFLSACAENDPELYNTILDNIIVDDLLCEFLTIFQVTSEIDQRGVQRLNEGLDSGRAKVEYYVYLSYGRRHETIGDDDLATLLEKILSRENGIDIAIEILAMRFHRKKDIAEYSKHLISVARDVLCMYKFSKDKMAQNEHDYELSQIAEVCLCGKDGRFASEELSKNLAQAIIDDRVYTFDYQNLLTCLAQIQPFVFLNEFIGNEKIKPYQRRRSFSASIEDGSKAVDHISENDIIDWCEKDPERRYQLITSMLRPFMKCAQNNKMEWKPIILRIFDIAPDLDKVFENVTQFMDPISWSGSRADIIQDRSLLLKELENHDNAEVRSLAKAKYSHLQGIIAEVRKTEEDRNRRQYESFE